MSLSSRRLRGLTLIELIVVIAILAILAGLALPKLDVFTLKAGKAQAAANIGAVAEAVTTYRATNNLYPNNWDSLLDSANNTALASNLHPSLTGAPGGTATKLSTTTLTAEEVNSLTRVMGEPLVVDLNIGASIAGDSADVATQRALATGDTVATLNLADTSGKVKGILNEYYPELAGTAGNVLPNNKKLVVFGLGKLNTMIGKNLVNAPTYGYIDQINEYNRILVVFEVDAGGGRAEMVGTLGADGDRREGEIQDFYKT